MEQKVPTPNFETRFPIICHLHGESESGLQNIHAADPVSSTDDPQRLCFVMDKCANAIRNNLLVYIVQASETSKTSFEGVFLFLQTLLYISQFMKFVHFVKKWQLILHCTTHGQSKISTPITGSEQFNRIEAITSTVAMHS